MFLINTDGMSLRIDPEKRESLPETTFVCVLIVLWILIMGNITARGTLRSVLDFTQTITQGGRMADNRDLRDPQALGEDLFWRRERAKPGKPFHVLADYSNRYSKIPNYPEQDSMGTEQVKKYQAELHERAAGGDKYAIGVLEEGAWNEPVDL